MFEFVKQMFISEMMLISFNLSNLNLWKCVSMSNQECKIRPEIVNVSSDKPTFYPYNVK